MNHTTREIKLLHEVEKNQKSPATLRDGALSHTVAGLFYSDLFR